MSQPIRCQLPNEICTDGLAKKLKRGLMVISVLFQFLEERMSSSKVMANKVSVKQVPFASLNVHGLTQKRKLK